MARGAGDGEKYGDAAVDVVDIVDVDAAGDPVPDTVAVTRGGGPGGGAKCAGGA